MFGNLKKQKAKLHLKYLSDNTQGFPFFLHTHSSNQGVAREQRDCCLFTLLGVQDR